MLLQLSIALLFSIAGLLVVARVAHVAMRRLHLDPYEVLTWLGLAELPLDELSARRKTPAGGNHRHRPARSLRL